MTTEYFEQQIERFKQEGKLPEDFEITEMLYFRGTSEIEKAVGSGSDESTGTSDVYVWCDALGTLKCEIWDKENDLGESRAVAFNAEGDPEFAFVLSPWIPPKEDLDIREP